MSKHNMLKHISWERRKEIIDEIESMTGGAHKSILELIFIHELSTAEAVTYCAEHGILKCDGTPYSRRMINYIITKYIPDYSTKARPHNPQSKKRANHEAVRDKKTKTFCAFCGCRENLELHHMIPIFLGGTEENANLIWLCTNCHKDVTAYQRSHFKQFFLKKQSS